jgi:uncharacterized protein (DUF433 family)
MASGIEIGTLIVLNPKIRGGRPKIVGTGLTVRRIVGWFKMGMSPEEIAVEYPHLSLAQVHAALALLCQSGRDRSRYRPGRSSSGALGTALGYRLQRAMSETIWSYRADLNV